MSLNPSLEEGSTGQPTEPATGGGVPVGTLAPLSLYPAPLGQKKARRNQRAIVPNPISHPKGSRPEQTIIVSYFKAAPTIADWDLPNAIASIRFSHELEIVLSFRQLRQLEAQIKQYLDTPEEK